MISNHLLIHDWQIHIARIIYALIKEAVNILLEKKFRKIKKDGYYKAQNTLRY